MGDLISRQAAIDVLEKGLSKIPYMNNTDEDMIRRDERIGCIQEVRGLPSVQPLNPLKPCPKCGCKAELIEKKIYGITCLNYSCDNTYVDFYESKEQAIEMWNKGEPYKGE